MCSIAFMWNVHLCWQGAKESKPRSTMQCEGLEEPGPMGGRDSTGILESCRRPLEVIWKGKGLRLPSPISSPSQGTAAAAAAVYVHLDSQLFSLSDVNFTCHAIILIFISLTTFDTLCWEMTPCLPHMSPGDFPAVSVGDGDWKGELARGFHNSLIQPEFWDIVIFGIIYSDHGI